MNAKSKSKTKIKKGDQVLVISGASKGKSGKVLQVLRQKDRVLVENIAMIKKHQKAVPDKMIEGGLVERESSIHISNVKKIEKSDSKNPE